MMPAVLPCHRIICLIWKSNEAEMDEMRQIKGP